MSINKMQSNTNVNCCAVWLSDNWWTVLLWFKRRLLSRLKTFPIISADFYFISTKAKDGGFSFEKFWKPDFGIVWNVFIFYRVQILRIEYFAEISTLHIVPFQTLKIVKQEGWSPHYTPTVPERVWTSKNTPLQYNDEINE